MSLFIYFYLFDDLRLIIRIAIWLIAASSLIAAIGLTILYTLLAKEKYLKARAERLAIEKNATFNSVVSPSGQVIISQKDTEKWINRQFLVGQQPTNIPLLSQSNNELLPALDNIQRCLIVGASDSGKTNLLHHIISRKIGKVIVIDPHAYPDKWANCTVVGSGRNYKEIGGALEALVKLMTKRYEEIGKGLVVEGHHSERTIIIDEWRAIVKNLGKPAESAIGALLTESRKAAFSVFVATHSERVKALGIEGEGDLKDGFGIVRLSLINGKRSATLDTGNGQVEMTLPGIWKNDNADDIFVTLVQEGLSRRKAAMKAYGRAYAGDVVDRGKRALGEL